jgi:F0F1-type ATP synthase epsilon subunit
MKLTAVSPFGEEFSGAIDAVVVDTVEGRHVILPEHGDFVGIFDLTEITVIQSDDARVVWAAFGYVHVFNGDVVVIAQIVDADPEAVQGFHDRITAGRTASSSRFSVAVHA